MKKQDLAIIGLLFVLWIFWPYLDRQITRHFYPDRWARAQAAATQTVERVEGLATPPADVAFAEKTESVVPPPRVSEAPIQEKQPARPRSAPEQTIILSNEQVEITLSSYGAAVSSALLKDYRQTIAPDSDPVVLNFESCRSLALVGVEGLSEQDDFELVPVDDRTVRFEKKAASGMAFSRTYTLDAGYLLRVTDVFVNSTPNMLSLSGQALQLGCLRNLEGEKLDKGVVYLGVDTLSPGGEGVQYLAKAFPKWFDQVAEKNALTKLPMSIDWPLEKPVNWIAVKNKYFVEILTPEGGGDRCAVQIRRTPNPKELADPAYRSKMTPIEEVSATIVLPDADVPPGESLTRSMQYYVGPKKFSELSRYGMHQVDVMEFGFWRPISKVLLVIMNWIHDYIWPHNYGLAIMLLTIIIRVVFWPITHKSTESMKRMQALQPLMTEIRAKYKDNPQKQQQAIMALYKEHKVNPLGGCLPMLIQIPVFIALFVVLRSAIELRFASFLWIKDLSSPERLFADVLPIPLNILPILMAATMAWQQKLTPSGGDPQQQKIMMFMPLMMLVFFYNFAAGLSLYWTTNQVLMIVQLLLQKRKQARAVN